MNNEKYNQIIDEVYENYLIEDARILPNMSKEKMLELGFRLTKEEFINKCKTDSEFSKKWGLKIEERELSFEERFEYSHNVRGLYYLNIKRKQLEEELNNDNIPTKLITITYNGTKIESYE
jgi:hypothetical protein